LGVASAISPVARKPLLEGFVAGSLYTIVNLPRTLKRDSRETYLTKQTSDTEIVHAHGALLTDVARTLQTAACTHYFMHLTTQVIEHFNIETLTHFSRWE
jgi:hypothetical protein